MTTGDDPRAAVRRTILERRTIHAYTRDLIPDGALERALEAAAHAPNHRLTWPWRFICVGRDTRARLAAVAVRLKTRADTPLDPNRADEIHHKICDPHALVVVTIQRSPNPEIAREDYASAACAIMNLHLSLWSEGVGSKWSTGKLIQDPESLAILGIDAEHAEVVGFVWVGIPAVVPEKPARPEMETLVRTLP